MGAGGRIGRTIKESEPSFAPAPRPPAGAPNVVVIVLDDLGFAQLGCFGSDIATPAIDGSPRGGLRYNRFHVTGALLADPRVPADRPQPPRGRHGLPHRHPDGVPRLHRAHPALGGDAAARPARRRATTRSPSASGTWRRGWEQIASGPFDRWPLGLGFERYYGFLGGDTNQWTPRARARQPLRRAAARHRPTATTSPRTSPTRRSA